MLIVYLGVYHFYIGARFSIQALIFGEGIMYVPDIFSIIGVDFGVLGALAIISIYSTIYL